MARAALDARLILRNGSLAVSGGRCRDARCGTFSLGCMADHTQAKCQPRTVIRERAGPNEEECEIYNHNHPDCPLFTGVKPSWW